MQCDSCLIKNLIYRYADHIDRGDLRGAAAMFRRGKIIATGADGLEHELAGEDAVYATYSAFTRLYQDSGTPHTQHMTTNVMIDVADDGKSATGQAYAIVFQAVEDFSLQPIIGVRYEDRFEKSAKGWIFSERKIVSLLPGDVSRHLLQSV